MYWQHKNKYGKQILASRYSFSQGNVHNISLPIENLSEKNCPISLAEFEDYDGIPIGISSKGIEGVKEFFISKGAKYICFIGVSEAIHV